MQSELHQRIDSFVASTREVLFIREADGVLMIRWLRRSSPPCSRTNRFVRRSDRMTTVAMTVGGQRIHPVRRAGGGSPRVQS